MVKKNVVLFVVLFFVLPTIGFAQAGGPPSIGPPSPPGLPIDGITGVLFLIGLIYGSVKIFKDSSS
ncbi:hypothetical protein [Polaribacter butkevichii]|uniref:Signal peptidase n=1 Tax=Polaribacter butkevichii TaxID=218490 RepID=A0A2P6CBA8_9FLAO|nr:hypothetical protein [Polaribacter butkevichii]PQJ72177.1 hypothetical protein BTO14_02445 [Polaribacter butkevichii]